MTPEAGGGSVVGMGKPACVLNNCGQEQGIGTWVRVAGLGKEQPVCEQHWQALRNFGQWATK